MTKEEAIELLNNTNVDRDMPCSINPGITQGDALDIVRRAIDGKPAGSVLEDWMVKRVKQVSHPIYRR